MHDKREEREIDPHLQRAKNREYARKCRQRRKEKEMQLGEELMAGERKNRRLKREKGELLSILALFKPVATRSVLPQMGRDGQGYYLPETYSSTIPTRVPYKNPFS